ncbi:hypothetical protein PO360_21865 [Enterobacter ludwigii]|uniref:hypothetical protein n=1 Tax=Enterobacter cloacae complex TaxID=354276 RepID=UPI002FD6565F
MGVELNYQFQKQVSTKWVPVIDCFSNDRSYLLYSWLGLKERNDGTVTAIAPLRGLPEDMELGWDDEYGWDDSLGEHSYSWLLSDEILAAARPIPEGCDDSGPVVDEFCSEVKKLHELYGAVRIVLGFTG